MTLNAGRRCALPGCYVVIEVEPDGRPRRKYCTPAHRAVARQARREGANRSAHAPPLPPPELPLPPLVPWSARDSTPRRQPSAETTGRRARAMAVLGSAGLLVTGGSVMFRSAAGAPPPSAAPLAADPETEPQWMPEAMISGDSGDAFDSRDRYRSDRPQSRPILRSGDRYRPGSPRSSSSSGYSPRSSSGYLSGSSSGSEDD